MQHLDEGTIHAWLDGELPLAEGEAAAAHVAQCEQCAMSMAEARGFIAASSRILTALDAVPGGVWPAAQKTAHVAGARAPVRFRVSRAWMAAAAVLVLSTVTVIVIRPRRDVALRVAEARKESKTAARSPAAPQPSLMDSTAVGAAGAPAASAHAASAPAVSARKPSEVARARVPAEDAPVLAGSAEDKLSTSDFASRKDEREKAQDQGNSVARAAAPPPPSVAEAPAPTADSLAAKRVPALHMSEVVVTGAGTTTSTEKLGSAIASDTASPRVVSRRTSTARGDTAVTTVYDVQGVVVTLIDRSAPPTDLRGATMNDIAPRARLQAQKASAINSITWSDSTGHLRTLRGPTSLAELGRVRALLFGPTP